MRCGPRSGITLLEVLLVMALLVAIASMAAPALQGTLDGHRLRNAADTVRVAWTKARVEAMETGRTYLFRYQPSGNLYTVEPLYTQDDYLESAEVTQNGVALNTNSALAGVSAGQPSALATPTGKTEELAEGIVFTGSEATVDLRAALLTGGATTSAGLDSQWSEPIFFYSDGTTSTARLALANQRECYVLLTLRGLTGIVEVSGLLGAEELP